MEVNNSTIVKQGAIDNVTMDNNGTGNNFVLNPCLWKKCILPFQLLTFLAALLGNIMVCVVAYRLRQSSNAKKGGDTNMYILIICLAVSDLGMAIFVMPVSMFITLFPDYELPMFVCLSNYIFLRYLLGMQLILLISLSLDRYFIICTSRKKELSLIASLLSTYIIPLVIVGVSISHWYDCKVIPQLTICYIDWTVHARVLVQLLDAAFSCILMAISLGVMTVSYAAIFLTIRKATKVGIRNGIGSQIRHLRRERKVAIMLLACVMLFWVCWAPVAVFFAIMSLSSLEITEIHEAVTIIIIWLLCINSAMNPTVYAFGSQQYRKELSRVFRLLKCKTSMPRQNIVQTDEGGPESADLIQEMRVKNKTSTSRYLDNATENMKMGFS